MEAELFKRDNLTLETLLKAAQAHEQANGFVNKMNACSVNENACESVNFTRSKGKGKQKVERDSQSRDQPKRDFRRKHGGAHGPKQTCRRCGYKGHISSDPSCSALKQVCNGCGLKGHFEKMCLTKDKTKKVVRQVDQKNDTDNEDQHYVFGMNETLKNEKMNVVVG